MSENRRAVIDILLQLSSTVACVLLSSYAISYFFRNPEQERVKALAKQKLDIIWRSLGREGPTPQFTEFELMVLKDIVLPQEIRTCLDDIGGLESIKATLWETVLLPFVAPHLFQPHTHTQDDVGHNLLSAPLGVLFYGPPGTGKTMMAKAIAKSTNAVFIPLDFSTLYNKYLGESEKITKAVFTLAQKLSPTIIFIDEVDVFLRKRGNTNEHEAVSMMKGQFMTLWDGLLSDSRAQVMIMGATNRPFDLDEAILRRFPRQILFGLPQTNEREAILRVLLSKSIIDPSLSTICSWVARQTADYSGSDLKELCKFAAMQPMREIARSYNPQTLQATFPSHSQNGVITDKQLLALQSTITPPKPRHITIDDFKLALQHIKPTGRDALDHLQNFYSSQLLKNPFISTMSNTPNTQKSTSANAKLTSISLTKKPKVSAKAPITLDQITINDDTTPESIDDLIAQLEGIKAQIISKSKKESTNDVESLD